MAKRILARLLLANILAIALGFAGHCVHIDLEADAHEHSPAQMQAPEDCDHCFFCTGAGEESELKVLLPSLPLSHDIPNAPVTSAPVFDLSLDLPPKL
jgi:hypothetical protein